MRLAPSLTKKQACVLPALLLGLGLALAAFLPTLLLRDGRILLRGDFVTQQVPFMLEARRMLLSGTPFWSWNTFLGENFLGTYSFYVYGSPFFWPLVLLPEAALPAGVTVMFLLKHAVAAAGAALYLSRYVENRWYAVLGGLLYAFSSFSLDSTFYYHFLDVIAVFPFLLYALDRVLRRERGGMPLFAGLVFLQALVNYYFFIAVSFFFLIYLFFKWKTDGDAPKSPGFYVRLILLYGGGALLASFVLLPSAFSMLETSKASESYGDIWNLLALIPQWPMLIKGLILPHEGIDHSAVYFQFTDYCSNTAFIPLFGAVLFWTGIKRWPDAWENRLARFLIIFSLIPLANGLFSLFTNLTYTRWWFMLVLLLVLVTLRTVERMADVPREEALGLYKGTGRRMARLALWVTLPFVALRVLVTYILGDIFPEPLEAFLTRFSVNKPFAMSDLVYLLLLLFLIAANYLPLAVCIRKDVLRRAPRLLAVGIAVCLVNYAAYVMVGEGYIGGGSHIPNGTRVETSAPREGDAPLPGMDYRYRSQYDGLLDNRSMLFNRPGIRTFTSIKSKAASAFGRRVGYNIIVYPDTQRYFDTQALYALLGVKEYLTENSAAPGAGYTYQGTQGGWSVYGCDAYVPMGYVYDTYIVDDSPDQEAASTDREANNRVIETMVKTAILDSETAGRLRDVVSPCPPERLAASWQEAAADNRRSACTDFSADSRGFSAKSSGDKERLVFFSVPHDNGWHATVDGEEAEIFTVQYGLMGVVVPAGTDVPIEFRFETPGLQAGAALSLAALAGLLIAGGAWLIRARKGKTA